MNTEQRLELDCLFDYPMKCKILIEKDCFKCRTADEAKAKCSFYCDEHTHYIDKKTEFVGDIIDGVKIPIHYAKAYSEGARK